MPDYTLKTEIGDGDVPVTIEFEYFPGLPAKVNAPMEDCYPAEAATFEVVEVSIPPSTEPLDITDIEIWPKLIEQKCLDHVASIGEA